MARIVAIMFFLCKLFFDLPDINTEFPNPAFRHVDDVDSSRSNNVIRQSRMAMELNGAVRFLLVIGWMGCEGFGVTEWSG